MTSSYRLLVAVAPVVCLTLPWPAVAQDCRAAIERLAAISDAEEQAARQTAGGGPTGQSGTTAAEHPQWGDPIQENGATADEATAPGAVTDGDAAETHPQAGAPQRDPEVAGPTLRSGDVAETQPQQGDPARDDAVGPESRQRLLALHDRAEALEAQGRERECLDVIEEIEALQDVGAAQEE